MSWEPIVDGIKEAARLIATADSEVIEVASRSLQVSLLATLIATLIGLPIGVAIGVRTFRGKFLVRALFNTLLGMPTVSLGLFLYVLMSRSGPLGSLNLLYTPEGVALGEAVLVTPIVISLTENAVSSKETQVKDLVRTLGASELQTSLAVLREASRGVALAIIASFNRAFSELGIAMMIGANIRGVTRVLTTAISLETSKGEIGLSFALSFILVGIVLTLNLLTGLFQRET
ncbi:MAG: ABC transporter permease [Candidatus Bathyarchaeia archaeon]